MASGRRARTARVISAAASSCQAAGVEQPGLAVGAGIADQPGVLQGPLQRGGQGNGEDDAQRAEDGRAGDQDPGAQLGQAAAEPAPGRPARGARRAPPVTAGTRAQISAHRITPAATTASSHSPARVPGASAAGQPRGTRPTPGRLPVPAATAPRLRMRRLAIAVTAAGTVNASAGGSSTAAGSSHAPEPPRRRPGRPASVAGQLDQQGASDQDRQQGSVTSVKAQLRRACRSCGHPGQGHRGRDDLRTRRQVRSRQPGGRPAALAVHGARLALP